MGRTTALREAIKRDFVPVLRDKGFVLEKQTALIYPFRKIDSDVVFECSVQWEKYGSPRFILNFAKRGPEGLLRAGDSLQAKGDGPKGGFAKIAHGSKVSSPFPKSILPNRSSRNSSRCSQRLRNSGNREQLGRTFGCCPSRDLGRACSLDRVP